MTTDPNEEIAALRAELAAVRAELAALRARQAPPAPEQPGAVVRLKPRWKESDSGAWVCQAGGPVTRGEELLTDLPWPHGWLLATGVELTDRNRTRQVDALVISPGGIAVLEQKDTANRGRVVFRTNAPTLIDGVEVPALTGALQQARLPAQMLSTVLRNQSIRAGYIAAMLTVHGPVTVRREEIGGVLVTHTSDAVGAAQAALRPHDPEEMLSAGTVLGVLTAVSLPLAGLPSLAELGYSSSAW